MIFQTLTENGQSISQADLEEIGLTPVQPTIYCNEPLLPEMEGKHFSEFAAYHRLHPKTYELLVKECENFSFMSRIPFGIVWETVRGRLLLEYRDENSQFLLNNNYRSYYTRMVIRNNPKWTDKIETRNRNGNVKLEGRMLFED